jgi:hypothetical protein
MCEDRAERGSVKWENESDVRREERIVRVVDPSDCLDPFAIGRLDIKLGEDHQHPDACILAKLVWVEGGTAQ